MRHTSALILMAVLVHVQSAPQFITFKDGKLGVNFAGYHAGVGIGGGAGNGAAGGLFAEAGTPHGQSAKAGLGGSVDGNSGSAGGLFAGATAGGNVKAAAGLGGGVTGDRAAGTGFAASSAGGHQAASGLGGESSVSGSSGFKFSGTKSFGIPTAVIQETEVHAVPVNHKVHTELKLDSANEIDSRIGAPHVGVDTQSTLNEDVQPKTIIEKTIVHTHIKPSHHHETAAHIGGFIGGEVHAPAPPAQKRVDVEVESFPQASLGGIQGSVHASSDAVANGGGQVTYKKEVAFEKNPNFFRDIFNIPISTLKAISGLISNTAAGTSIKVEKSDSINSGGYGQPSGYGQAGHQLDGSSQYGQSAQISGGFGGYSHGTGFTQIDQISGPGQYAHSAQLSGGFGGHKVGFGQNSGVTQVEHSVGGIGSGQYGQSAQINGGLETGFGQGGHIGNFLKTVTGGQIGGSGLYGQSAQISSGFGGQKSIQGEAGFGGHQFSAGGHFNHGLL